MRQQAEEEEVESNLRNICEQGSGEVAFASENLPKARQPSDPQGT